MPMDIRNDIQMARNVLLNGENGLDVEKYFSQNNFGDETPVNLDLLHKNTEKTIIIESEIQFVLDEINKLTQERGKEIPFFLTGKKLEDGTIRYDQIFTGKANNERVAQYSSEITRNNIEEKLSPQDNNINYGATLSNDWDNTFNNIAVGSNFDKKIIKQGLIEQADVLNNTLYRLRTQGKITEEEVREYNIRI